VEEEMKVILEFSVIPIGVGLSLSRYIAACERILREAGLHYELHANGTNVEGEWEAVFGAIQRCHESLHAMGVPRISTSIKVGTRSDREQSLAGKVNSVKREMEAKG
jgi:uncharacterized protein (TIGR00106 family)